MKKRLLHNCKAAILCILLLSTACNRKHDGLHVRSDQRVITDMAGRKVVVPKKITKVMGMSPVGTILIYTLAPDTLLGWNYRPAPMELSYIAEPYRNLPVIGGWFGKNTTGNLEEIIKAHPDVIIDMGSFIAGLPDRVQQQTHIPVVVLDGSLKRLPDAYAMAGDLLGAQARAAMLGAECRRSLQGVEDKLKTVPVEKRRRFYYAEGPSGLETEPANSMHTESMSFAGGVNVAATVPNQQGYGHTQVSMEQVLRWDPEIVISGYDHDSSPGAFYRTVWTNPAWRRVSAVRQREVYEMPQYPYAWLDRPPSVNRVIGIKWLANLLYPDVFRYDIRAETRAFYAMFYHLQLSDRQLDELLRTATRTPAK